MVNRKEVFDGTGLRILTYKNDKEGEKKAAISDFYIGDWKEG